ncbi:MAG: hypothetical protein B7O98_09515 [Zestosphaera tikiterensis]|uniref:CRISPR-associated protein n=1 Tax=Zestosphaera tikiterensis TaxID=1973259 RepID=A0A2R7Y177_9CREN|nr:MAG: hypothetical protein B7O98_09515 [Zestosphaera tikiterensis]
MINKTEIDNQEGKSAFILASWGNPYEWYEVEYLLEPEDELKLRVKSISSLSVILRYYISKLGVKNVRALVFIPETLLCASNMISDFKVEEVTKCISNEYSEVLERLRSNVTEYVKNKVVKTVINCLSEVDLDSLIKVYVLPNVGKYQCNKETVEWKYDIDTDISSFYGALALIVGFIELKDFIKHNGKKHLELAVDITHGINYMPLMLFRTSLFLARIASVELNNKVTFKVYNSEPYTKAVKGGGELKVRIVDKEDIEKTKAIQRLIYSYTAYLYKTKVNIENYDEKSCGNSWIKDLNKNLNKSMGFQRSKKLFDLINCLAASIHYSLPLPLVTFSYWYNHELSLKSIHEEIPHFLNEFIREINKYVHIEKNNNNYLIKRLIVLNYNKVKGLLAGYAIAKYSVNVLNEVMKDEKHVKFQNNCEFYISAEKLNYLLDEYLKGAHYLTSSNELSQIQRKYSENLLIKKLKEGTECCNEEKDVDKRNFIAHCGLEQNITCIKEENGIIFLKYCRKDEGKIRETLENGLKELYNLLKSDL